MMVWPEHWLSWNVLQPGSGPGLDECSVSERRICSCNCLSKLKLLPPARVTLEEVATVMAVVVMVVVVMEMVVMEMEMVVVVVRVRVLRQGKSTKASWMG